MQHMPLVVGPFVLLLPFFVKIIWLCNHLPLSVPDEGYSKKRIVCTDFDIYVLTTKHYIEDPKYYPGNMSIYYSTKYHYRNLHEA
jgi:hypothetical protein